MNEKDIERFVNNWNRIHKETSRVLCAVPDERLDWRPKDDMFTMRELIGHIPQAEDVLGRTAIEGSYQKTQFDFANSNAKQITDAFDRLHDSLAERVSHMSPEQLSEDVEFHGRTLRRSALLRFMTEHEIHHRGQLVVYYRLAGLEPPDMHD